MARGKKTSPEMVYQIMTSWTVTNNYMETARDLKLPVTTVKNIVDKNKDKPEFVKLRNEKGQEFSEMASRLIKKAASRLEKELDDESRDIPVNHLTTVIGTLYDKKALADGDATERMDINITLPEGVDEYAE